MVLATHLTEPGGLRDSAPASLQTKAMCSLLENSSCSKAFHSFGNILEDMLSWPHDPVGPTHVPVSKEC